MIFSGDLAFFSREIKTQREEASLASLEALWRNWKAFAGFSFLMFNKRNRAITNFPWLPYYKFFTMIITVLSSDKYNAFSKKKYGGSMDTLEETRKIYTLA